MIELTVKGMDCNHCVQTVTEAVTVSYTHLTLPTMCQV